MKSESEIKAAIETYKEIKVNNPWLEEKIRGHVDALEWVLK